LIIIVKKETLYYGQSVAILENEDYTEASKRAIQSSVKHERTFTGIDVTNA